MLPLREPHEGQLGPLCVIPYPVSELGSSQKVQLREIREVFILWKPVVCWGGQTFKEIISTECVNSCGQGRAVDTDLVDVTPTSDLRRKRRHEECGLMSCL